MGTVHAIETARHPHYALSEDTQFRLQCLNNAMLAVANMVERNPGQDSAELEGEWLGGLFRVFSFQLEEALIDAPFAKGSELLQPKRP